jgi:hypothetical protein
MVYILDKSEQEKLTFLLEKHHVMLTNRHLECIMLISSCDDNESYRRQFYREKMPPAESILN